MLALDWLLQNRKWTLINVLQTLVQMVSMRIPHIICVEGDTDMLYSADKGGNPSIQCKMTFNLSTSTGEIDGLRFRWLWCSTADIVTPSTWECVDSFWECNTFFAIHGRYEWFINKKIYIYNFLFGGIICRPVQIVQCWGQERTLYVWKYFVFCRNLKYSALKVWKKN